MDHSIQNLPTTFSTFVIAMRDAGIKHWMHKASAIHSTWSAGLFLCDGLHINLHNVSFSLF